MITARFPGRPRARRWVPVAVALVLLVTGLALLADHGWMEAKAWLAERLIARAFAGSLVSGSPHAPWSGADFHPVARLYVPRLALTRHVLSGGSGSSMAFGLGHLDGTAALNHPGNAVLVGHRDSWMRFAKRLRPGDALAVTTPGPRGGRRQVYIVQGSAVVSERDPAVLEPTDRTQLTLVTCYPFGGLLGSPWRYVVIARVENAR